MKWLSRLFNQDEIKKLNETLESYRNSNKYFEKENERLKEFELKYKLVKLYIEDDDELIELLDLAKESASSKNLAEQQLHHTLNFNQAQQQAMMQGMGYYTPNHLLGGLLGGGH